MSVEEYQIKLNILSFGIKCFFHILKAELIDNYFWVDGMGDCEGEWRWLRRWRGNILREIGAERWTEIDDMYGWCFEVVIGCRERNFGVLGSHIVEVYGYILL